MDTSESQPAVKIVAQHNALINARFNFVPLQMRLFLALLSRIKFEDTDFKEHFIPASELVFERHGGSAYQQINEMCDNITSFKLYIELLEEGTRKRRRRPKYDYIPLMAKAGYDGELGGVVAAFNPLIMPYLLQLQESGNFTLAALAELRKLKSPYALRIYWLLKEYADFGHRTVSLAQLRFLLDIAETEYPRFSNFKARVLDKAQHELANTDLPFTFELERQNQLVQRIKFLFGLNGAEDGADFLGSDNPELPESKSAIKHSQHSEEVVKVQHTVTTADPDAPAWAQALRGVGVSQRSINQIIHQLEAKEYPPGYVDFVLARIGKQHQLGKVKKPAGAIYKALVEKYLLSEYLEQERAQLPIRTGKAGPKAKEPPKPTETAYALHEVRAMYDNPGPFLKRQLGEQTFEQHLDGTYLSQGFLLEQRRGEDWLVKRD